MGLTISQGQVSLIQALSQFYDAATEITETIKLLQQTEISLNLINKIFSSTRWLKVRMSLNL